MISSSALPDLVVPRDQLDVELLDRINAGEDLKRRQVNTPEALEELQAEYYTWDEFNSALLKRSFTTAEIAEEYSGARVFVGGGRQTIREKYVELLEDIARDSRKLTSIRSRLSLFSEQSTQVAHLAEAAASDDAQGIFIVHGHNEAVKLSVARFVLQVTGRDPIILHEQANSGQTVIEKFEEHAMTTGFAIVLLTADDEGRKRGEENLQLRARQNVILELGFFVAKLGRRRVAALHEDGVEVPSDFSGVLYTSIAAGWEMELGREMRAAGIEVDMNKAR